MPVVPDPSTGRVPRGFPSVILKSSVRGYSRRQLKRAVLTAMRRLGVGGAELSLSVVTEREMIAANQKFFGRSGPTDVIAISQVEGASMPMPEQTLGDVIVSIAAARTQSAELGHSLQKELSILAVHGLLHTLGMRDNTAVRRRAMMAKTARLLRAKNRASR